MKFSVSRDQFLSQLGIAVRGVSTRSAIQTLAGVLIRAESGGVELQATDMELGIRVRVDTAPEREGAVVLPGRLLLDVVRSLPKDDLSLEHRTSEQDVEVVSGPSKFHLRTLPLDDFPKLPEAGGASTMHVPAGAFVETIGRRGGGDRDRRAREPGDLQPRRCRDLLAPRRGPLPQLPPAPAGGLRARAERQRARAARSRAEDQPACAEERAAAAR